MPKVYVVIVTYNGYKWIDKCLSSLLKSTIDLHIIVVDNLSTDKTVEFIKNEFPNVDLILQENNLGFGKANNIGISKALKEGADYVFLLNQDAWIELNTIELLLNQGLQNPEYGIISPIHLVAEKDHFESSFSNFIVPPYGFTNFMSDLYFNRVKELYETRFINAAGWLLSKKCLLKVGGFDPVFFHYEEDMNYTHRVLFHGFKIGFVPEAKMCHDCANRKIEQRHLDNAYFNRLLTGFLNINNKSAIEDFNKFLILRFFKNFKLIFRFRYQTLKKNIKILQFSLKNRKAILNSIKTNIQPGSHYL